MNDGGPEPIADSMEDYTEVPARGEFRETLITIFYAIIIALVIRTTAYQPFNIPSESMLPTLLVGDYLFVSKFSYGYSKHSIPMSPNLFEGRIFESQVKRGDVAVFKKPSDNKTDFIKRIMGLPGDEMQVRQGQLYINGRVVPRTQIEDFVHTDDDGNKKRIPQYVETLPNGASYRVLDITRYGNLDNTRVYKVPAKHYFAMGDNRDNSLDSRVASGVGYVPAVNLVGRAEILFFSTDGTAQLWEFWRWPIATRFSRIFTSLDPSSSTAK